LEHRSAGLNVTVGDGTFANVATITGNEADPVPGNNVVTAGVTGAPPPVTTIPTLGGIGLGALILLLGAAGAFVVFRRR